MHVLAFDLGTTNVKACLVDEAGHTLAVARRPLSAESPQPGWCQVDPGALVDTIFELADEVRSAAGRAEVAAVSFVGQANSFLLLDAQNRSLTPIILWSDQRAAAHDERLIAIAAQPGFRFETGVAELTAEFMVAKLLWLARHEPARWARARRFCQIGDFLVWKLTGRHATEASLAGLTGLSDIHRLSWRPAAIAAAGLEQFVLPKIVRSGAIVAPLAEGLRTRLGANSSSVVVAGCLDQFAGALGAGCVETGSVCETTGTVLATVALSDLGVCDQPGVFVGPAFRPGLYWRMRFGNVSGNLLEDYRKQQPDQPSFQQLDAEAAAATGAVPQLDLQASAAQRRAVFIGATLGHQRGHFVRAILAGVAQALIQQLTELGMLKPERICCAGSAARSELWLQIKADTLGIPVGSVECEEPTCFGGAILAAAGVWQMPVAERAREWTSRKRQIRTPRVGRTHPCWAKS